LKITIFNGKIHYKSPFSIATLNYQRVNPIFFLSYRSPQKIEKVGNLEIYVFQIFNHWIGLRENFNRKPWFLPSNIGLKPVNFPIIQFYDSISLSYEKI